MTATAAAVPAPTLPPGPQALRGHMLGRAMGPGSRPLGRRPEALAVCLASFHYCCTRGPYVIVVATGYAWMCPLALRIALEAMGRIAWPSPSPYLVNNVKKRYRWQQCCIVQLAGAKKKAVVICP